MNELKACPFCGGVAKLERSVRCVGVACEDCDAEILRKEGALEPDRTAEAIAAWNTRVPDPEIIRENAALWDMLTEARGFIEPDKYVDGYSPIYVLAKIDAALSGNS